MSKSDEQNKRKNKAAALRYRLEEDASPVVIASGYGQIADKIIGVAEEKGIPVFKDDSAASMLCMLQVGRNIPGELYEVVAAIYMQILTASQKVKKAGSAQTGGGGLSNAEAIRRQLNDGKK